MKKRKFTLVNTLANEIEKAFGQRLGVGRRRFMEFLLPNPSEALTLPRCKT